MKKFILLSVALLMAVAVRLSAQESNMKMRFDFTNVSGKNVTDDISGITAGMVNSAKVVDMGQYKVLSLGTGSDYLDMTAAAGKLFAGMDNYSISMYYRIDDEASLSGNGYFLWAFSTLAACTSTGGVYSAYRLNAQRIASSTGGYSNETGYSIGTESAKGQWMHVAYTQEGSTGRLYLNGQLKGTVATMPLNSALYAASTPSCCWIGRAPFSADSYLQKALMTDFRLYDCALTADDITAMAAETDKLEDAYLHGTPGDVTALQTAINEAKSVTENTSEYLPDAISELRDYITMAETAVTSGNSQFYIDKVCETLATAIANTKATAGISLPDLDELAKAYDTDRGFIHPGGLHTQADFDRIKQQLAEGNATVTAAYNVLKAAEYAQAGTSTWPVETIVRGGTSGQNYINAARGATIAYQNALRWKIEGNKSCANTAVNTLMAWARVTKYISGDSNWALASGLYGYEFAQAAELMRDYDGWAEEDFTLFKKWMLNVWYPACLNFLRGRNGTWENWVGNQGGYRPGHYWSNWGLCNAFAVISIGILCDDVFIYNQGMSYMKYDQVGSFKKTRTDNPILNDGLTEYLGNLVVTTSQSALETGAYGEMGQMQESGRDGGHAAMALGLAVDIAHMAWNQGDDLFAYMDHRLAAGIEFVAACSQNVQNLPWTNYKYVDCRTAWHNGWLMSGPAEPAEVRNYWGAVIGIYEGVKGIKMPYAETAYGVMGIDAGGLGSVSGGYDHLGYSVLMNTRDTQLAAAENVPTELSPEMEYSGSITSDMIPSLDVEKELGNINSNVIKHSELGGLVNSFMTNNKTCVPRGETVKLMPQLPDGEEDTGLWQWNTGATTREITVNTERSFIYRATYTNRNGVKSQQSFSIAVKNDCTPSDLTPVIVYNDKTFNNCDTISVLYGQTATLSVNPSCGMGDYQWSTGQTTQSITTAPMVSERDYTVFYSNQGNGLSAHTFHVNVIYAEPYIITAGGKQNITETLLAVGDDVTIGLTLPTAVNADDVTWSDGSKGAEIVTENIQSSASYTASFAINGTVTSIGFNLYVKQEEAPVIEKGNYIVKEKDSNRLLTAHGSGNAVTFEEGDADAPGVGQVWFLNTRNSKTYYIMSLPDSLVIGTNTKLSTLKLYSFYFEKTAGLDLYAMHTGSSAAYIKYWTVSSDGSIDNTGTSLTAYPYLLIPAKNGPDGVETVNEYGSSGTDTGVYDLSGRRITGSRAQKGIYIVNKKKIISL